MLVDYRGRIMSEIDAQQVCGGGAEEQTRENNSCQVVDRLDFGQHRRMK